MAGTILSRIPFDNQKTRRHQPNPAHETKFRNVRPFMSGERSVPAPIKNSDIARRNRMVCINPLKL